MIILWFKFAGGFWTLLRLKDSDRSWIETVLVGFIFINEYGLVALR